jgi:hypothetical protein
VRHSAIALSRAQTDPSKVQGRLGLENAAHEPDQYGRNPSGLGALELGPVVLNTQDSVSPRPLLGILVVTERHGFTAKESLP